MLIVAISFSSSVSTNLSLCAMSCLQRSACSVTPDSAMACFSNKSLTPVKCLPRSSPLKVAWKRAQEFENRHSTAEVKHTQRRLGNNHFTVNHVIFSVTLFSVISVKEVFTQIRYHLKWKKKPLTQCIKYVQSAYPLALVKITALNMWHTICENCTPVLHEKSIASDSRLISRRKRQSMSPVAVGCIYFCQRYKRIDLDFIEKVTYVHRSMLFADLRSYTNGVMLLLVHSNPSFNARHHRVSTF